MLDINIKSKQYENTTIIKELSLKVEKSQFLSIIGPSGCGKTTLLQMISNLDKNYLGDIFLDKKDMSSINIGFMFQDSRLIPWLTIYENILLVSKSKDEEAIVDALIEVGLEDYINSYAKELSGGMQRKVALVRAFINKPEVLLLDEPFISLDYPTAQALRNLLLKFYDKYNPTVIFVTHNLKEAISLSNRVVFLDKKPLKIIYDYKIETDLFYSLEDPNIDKIKENLLNKYPNILSGKLDTN